MDSAFSFHCLEPMPPYFLIKIGKQAQLDAKEKIGSLYYPTEFAFMQREMQFGLIEKIGEGAHEYIPQAEVGDYALIHHFVSGKKDDRGHNFYLVHEDDEFNWYVVNVYELPGERSLVYAIAKGEEIIPTPDYIFLECPTEAKDECPTVPHHDMMTVSKSGLAIPKERKKSREEWTEIMKKNMARIKELSYNLPKSTMDSIMIQEDIERKERYEYAMKEIKYLESVNAQISKDINKKRYEPFVVAAVNPAWNEYVESIFGEKINPGEVGYFLNMATNYKMDFGGVTFVICECKYFAGSEKYFKSAVTSYKHSCASTEKKATRSRNKSVRN